MRDLGSIPGLGWSPGERHGNPLQYSCLLNAHGQRHLVGYSTWGCKESDSAQWLITAQHISLPKPSSTQGNMCIFNDDFLTKRTDKGKAHIIKQLWKLNKNRTKQTVENYRSVSLMIIGTKILYKTLLDGIWQFILSHTHTHITRYGFSCKNRSDSISQCRKVHSKIQYSFLGLFFSKMFLGNWAWK